MAKPGRREGSAAGTVMTYEQIGAAIGLSERTVGYAMKSAMGKIKSDSETYRKFLVLITEAEKERERREKDVFQPTSVECRADYIRVHSYSELFLEAPYSNGKKKKELEI